MSGDKQTFQRIILENIKSLPMPSVEDLYNTKIASFAKEILEKQKNDSSRVETAIDMIVYKLFNLSEEEIRTIEKSLSLHKF